MSDESGVGPAPPETVQMWCEAVKRMSREALDSFERRTFRQWDSDSLGVLRVAIQRRRQEL